ncbi:hypothetical protein HPB48_017977 [Haemaphysalis longicornis]|uniref:Serpin domain-containing protein n=1 Tax=Haemaphysalis longicornis TaxID=44386 RepID=A0A9J6FH28_HAELO|nr:hypothetical protein HPB48_017977 [Haemaphysalis longicornis]
MAPEMAGPLLQFPIDLYRQMRATSDETVNLLLSPWLVACTLLMVHHGARGTTATEIARLLHVCYWDRRDGVSVLERLTRYARELPCNSWWPRQPRREGLRLTTYVCLYHAEQIKLTEDYLRAVKTLKVQIHRKDFARSAEQCRVSMDALVRAMTSYSLTLPGEALSQEEVNRDSKLVFTSLLRQEARWWRRFEEAPCGVFYETRDRFTTVPMMTQAAPYPCAECPELRASLVELPFECPRQSLVLVLPYEVEGLASVEQNLSASRILRALGCLRDQGELELTLPKFTVTSVTNLKRLLPAMTSGDEALSGNENFSGLCEEPGVVVKVSGAVHYAFFRAGRSGPSPPAEEMATIGDTSITPTEQELRKVTVDRPFMFLVVNREPDMVFLMGSVRRVVY